MQLSLAFHLVGVVLWMGGLLVVSRMLAYHASEPPTVRPRLSFIEGKLDNLVAVPGAVLTLATGLLQLYLHGEAWFRASGWMHAKLGLVAVVAVLHLVLSARRRAIARDRADAPIRKAPYSALHGTLGLLLIAIIVLATLRP